jgi:peptidoglycan-N-acetylglucosamine deacetylase
MNTRETLNLTFDDGPDPEWTPRILEQLRHAQVTATFFVVGEQVLKHLGIVRELLEHGHDVQWHCHRHVRHSQLTEAELVADTENGLEALAEAGVRPRLWRPPWGVCTEATTQVAERCGLQLRRWSIDTHDWRGDSAASMLDHARGLVARGGSVLMHDALGPGAARDGCENTAQLIVPLAHEVRRQGLALAPMQADRQKLASG